MFKKTAVKLALCPASLALAATVALGGSTPGFADDEVTAGPAAALVTVQNNATDADAGAIEALNLIIERQAAEVTDPVVTETHTPEEATPEEATTETPTKATQLAHRQAQAALNTKPAHTTKQKPVKAAPKTKPTPKTHKVKPTPKTPKVKPPRATKNVGAHPGKKSGNHPAKHKGNHPSKNGSRTSR